MYLLRGLLLFLTAVAGWGQQQPFACNTESETPFLLGGGASEMLGEVRLVCTGGTGSVDFDIRVFLNGDFSGRVAGGQTDAYMINGDPATPVLGQNIVRGTLESSNQLRFRIPSLPAPGSGIVRLRLVNLRAVTPDFTRLGLGAPPKMLAVVTGTLPFNNPQVTVGYVVPGFRFSLLNQGGAPVSGLAFAAAGTSTYRLRFQETFPLGFKRRNTATSLATPLALAAQANYGQEYGTESGFYLPSLGVTDGGLASQGTRLMTRLTNLPAGAVVRVGTVAAGGTVVVRLVATDKFGTGDYVAVTAEADGKATLSVVNGEARAVWEVLGSNAAEIESAEFEVSVTVGGAASQVAGASGQIGPVDSASVPRFRSAVWNASLEGGADFVQTPMGLSFVHTLGGAAPAAISIPLTSNGQPVAFTAEPATGGLIAGTSATPLYNWLRISATSGTTPAAFLAAVDPAGLSPGTYGGTIVVTTARSTETIFVLLTVRAGTAGAYSASCIANQGVPPIVRSNGLTELLGDLVITCKAPPAPITTGLTVTSNAPFTTGLATAAMLVNDPGPAQQSIGRNVIFGVPVRNGIYFSNIVLPAAQTAGEAVTLRVVNLRANAARIGESANAIPNTVQVLAKLANLTVEFAEGAGGFVQKGMNFRLAQGTSEITGPGQWTLVFTEGFGNSFKARNIGTAPGDPNGVLAQDFAGAIYDTETGFYSPAVVPFGLARQGTRLHAKFTGIPAGATITVPVTESASGPKTRLTQTDASGAGPFVAVPGSTATLTPVNGAATATWEVLNANPLTTETFQFPVIVTYGAGANGTIGVTGHLAPLSVFDFASNGEPTPRFALTQSNNPLCASLPCMRLPASITLASTGTDAVSTTVQIFSEADPTPWLAVSPVPWLRFRVAGGVTPANLTVIADPTGLAAGTYQTSISVNSVSIPVTFNVGGTGGGAGILFANEPIHFSYVAGAQPAAKQLTLTASPGLSLQTAANVPWLQAVISGTAITLSIVGNPLLPGEYDGIVTVTASGAASQSLRVHASVGDSVNTGSLGGRVLNMRPGITVQLTYGAGTVTVTPETDGAYQFFSLPSTAQFTVKPFGPSGFTFNPPTRSYTNLPIAGSADFTAIGPLTVSSVLPAFGQTAAQTFQFQFADSTGWQNLAVVNVLVNNYLDGRNACYIAYSVPNNVLYLVPDAGGGLLPGLVLNGAGSTANNQCTISGAGSSATGSGTTLTLTLSITFSTTSFSGNKVIYVAARSATENTGWETRGTRQVPGAAAQFPAARGVTPASGSGSAGTLTFTFDDAASGANLQTMWALINTAVDGRQACYVAYYRPGNQLYLYPDNGDGSQATNIVLTGANTIGNSQCTISAAGSGVQVSGARVTLTLPVTFKAGFSGPKGVWTAVQTMNAAQTSPWEALGNWTAP